jgi:glutamyl endopeptidase
MKRLILVASALLALAGCAAEPPAAADGETDAGRPSGTETQSETQPQTAAQTETAAQLAADLPRAEAQEGVALSEAPSMSELMARGIEPLHVDIPAELSRSVIIEKKIIGTDSRKPIGNTKLQPYSSIATLLITFPGMKSAGMCTGSVIGPDAVLTAGHCVYNTTSHAFASNIRVIPGTYPGANGRPTEPFGSSSGRKLYVTSAYRTATNFWQREQSDYAVIRTSLPLGNKTGIRKYEVMASPATGRYLQLVGYHGDLCKAPPCSPGVDAFIMNASADQIRQLFTGVFNHYADSYHGSSGSPLVSNGVDANKIFAVHVAGLANPKTGAEWNMGVLITKQAYSNIHSWVSAP